LSPGSDITTRYFFPIRKAISYRSAWFSRHSCTAITSNQLRSFAALRTSLCNQGQLVTSAELLA
jgi:hypothetical protein